MKANGDSIQFEYRSEISEILDAIAIYASQNLEGKNSLTIKEFYNLLLVMEMNW